MSLWSLVGVPLGGDYQPTQQATNQLVDIAKGLISPLTEAFTQDNIDWAVNPRGYYDRQEAKRITPVYSSVSGANPLKGIDFSGAGPLDRFVSDLTAAGDNVSSIIATINAHRDDIVPTTIAGTLGEPNLKLGDIVRWPKGPNDPSGYGAQIVRARVLADQYLTTMTAGGAYAQAVGRSKKNLNLLNGWEEDWKSHGGRVVDMFLDPKEKEVWNSTIAQYGTKLDPAQFATPSGGTTKEINKVIADYSSFTEAWKAVTKEHIEYQEEGKNIFDPIRTGGAVLGNVLSTIGIATGIHAPTTNFVLIYGGLAVLLFYIVTKILNRSLQ